jgi:hypothetical protein
MGLSNFRRSNFIISKEKTSYFTQGKAFLTSLGLLTWGISNLKDLYNKTFSYTNPLALQGPCPR